MMTRATSREQQQRAPEEGPLPDISDGPAAVLEQSPAESPLHDGTTVQSFADAMAENILHSVVNGLEESRLSHSEKLQASGEATVGEACRRPTLRDVSSSSLDIQRDVPLLNPAALQAPPTGGSRARPRRHPPPLAQTRELLPPSSAAGSLDYPDAPPTTPLLPELTRESRESFSRKLKEEEEEERSMDARDDFVQRLVVSLSAGRGEEWAADGREAGSAVDGYGGGDEGDDAGGPPLRGRRAMATAYAEVLSVEILDWVTNRQPPLAGGGGVTEGDGGVRCLADRMAQTIIGSTLREVAMHV